MITASRIVTPAGRTTGKDRGRLGTETYGGVHIEYNYLKLLNLLPEIAPKLALGIWLRRFKSAKIILLEQKKIEFRVIVLVLLL